MILFFYGPDDYRREAARREAEAELAKHGAVLHFAMGADDAVPEFLQFLEAQSLFADRKVAVLEDAFAKTAKEYVDALKHAADNEAVTLIITAGKKPESPFTFLLKKAEAQAFDHLDGKAWTAFITEEAKHRGVKLVAPVAALLARAYEGDAWGLVTELDKLSSYPKTIGEEHVLAEDPALAGDFWGLVNALKSPRAGDRLAALERLTSGGEAAQKVFHMLAYFWSGRMPAFAAYDMLVKSGKMDYEEALLDAVL